MDKVRCVDCGLLALKRTSALGKPTEWLEVTISLRNTWRTTANATVHRPDPECFAGAFDINKECGLCTNEEISATIEKERECEEFRKHQPNRSPKEHTAFPKEPRRGWRGFLDKYQKELVGGTIGVAGTLIVLLLKKAIE